MKIDVCAKPLRAALALALASSLAACTGQRPTLEETETVAEPIVGSSAAGSVPAGLPGRFMLGLGEGMSDTWMLNSGVPWDMRYTYLTYNWASNWNYGPRNGDYALWYLYDAYDSNTIPVIQYYDIVAAPGGGEQELLQKLGNAGLMAEYYNDYKLLMDRIKDYGATVVVLLEADAFGFAQKLANNNPGWYAAVSDSGVPELAGFPNTIAGWGLAFLKLRQTQGADNALLGIHVSAWASPRDPMSDSGANLQEEVDAAYNFLAPFGLGANQTGATFDFTVTDPCDRDADYYQLVRGQNRWWDSNDSAGTDSISFNRYAEWLKLWNQKTGKRSILWQIPVGNSNHLNVWNSGNPREGYKDNRPEYFLGNGLAHIQKFADAGVMALLFGAGAAGMSGYTNDTYSDGQLFVQTHAKAIYDQGGLDIVTGPNWMATDAGPNPRPETSFEAAPPPKTYDESFTAQYEWEGDDTLGWTVDAAGLGTVDVSTNSFYRGAKSLGVTLQGEKGTFKAYIANPPLTEGMPYVLFHVYMPAGHNVTSVYPYIAEGAANNYRWTGVWTSATKLYTDAWSLIAVELPADMTYPVGEIGVQFAANANSAGTILIDTVGWPDPAAYGEGAGGSAAQGGAGAVGTDSGTTGTGGGGGTNPIDPAGSGGSGSVKGDGCSCRLESQPFSSVTAWPAILSIVAWAARRGRPSTSRRRRASSSA